MKLTEIRTILSERLHALEQCIRTACRRASRARTDVTLVAVTKTVGPEIAALLPELGVLDLGESRPQELWRKAAALPKAVRWHLVGHLQRNKVERTLPLVSLIHSVDSTRLLKTLHEEAHRLGLSVDVLIEVKLSREPNKHGFAPEEVVNLFREFIPYLPRVHVYGLMTMAPFTSDPEQARLAFRELRQLAETVGNMNQDGGRSPLRDLSMGMTQDFEVAIVEGATIIRIGSALFEGLPESPS